MFQSRDNTLRFLALCGIAAPVIFAILMTVAGFLFDGYSHLRQAGSELGGVEASHPIVQNASFFVLGILIVAFAFGLHRGIGSREESKLGPILIGVFGLSSGVGNAFLPCDPGCEFQSLTGTMHNLTGLGGFIAAIAGIFIITRRLKEDPRWRSLYGFSRIAGVVVLVSLLLWIGVAKAAEVAIVNGALQRLFIGAWFVWIEVMAIRLFQLSRQSPERDAPLVDAPDHSAPIGEGHRKVLTFRP